MKRILKALGLHRIRFLRDINRSIRNMYVPFPLPVHGMNLANAPLRIYTAGIHEPGTTKFCESFIEQDWIVADIGAHFGYYSVLFGKLAKTVFVVEADRRNIPTITSNLRRNGISANVSNLAAYSKTGPLALCISRERGTSSIFGNGTAIEVQGDALDNRIERLDFFKMDIEGAETEALRGMRRLLAGVRGFVFEFSPKQLLARSIPSSEFLNDVRGYGFKISLICDDGTLRDLPDDALTTYAAAHGHVNLFCGH